MMFQHARRVYLLFGVRAANITYDIFQYSVVNFYYTLTLLECCARVRNGLGTEGGVGNKKRKRGD
uniref:Uncharacterized protein n=1 Tax=Daphnia magna TaxID=35525 RepID=A0A0P4Z001_9CRUS